MKNQIFVILIMTLAVVLASCISIFEEPALELYWHLYFPASGKFLLIRRPTIPTMKQPATLCKVFR